MERQAPIGLGHNRSLVETLADRYAADLAEANAVISRELPDKLALGDQAGLDFAAQLIRDCRAQTSVIDGLREYEKKPLDAAAREVQSFFASTLTALDATKRAATGLIDARNREAVAVERQRLLDQAEAERIEANRLQAEAAKLETKGHAAAADQLNDYAERSEQAAETMGARANASAATLVRTAVSGGNVSAKGVWVFDITDHDALRSSLGPLGQHFSTAEIEKAIRAFVAAEKKVERQPVLTGVLFRRDQRAVVR